MQADSIKKTMIVALGVCLVCSVFVSTATVSLHDIQEENKRLDKLKNILIAGDLYQDVGSIQSTYRDNIKAVVIDLNSGEIVEEDQLEDQLKPENYDIRKVISKPQYTQKIPAGEDIAKIKKRPKQMAVYLVQENEETSKFILPIYGKGLWSTLYGFMALDKDLKTIKGFTYYEHGETPGLGGEVDNPKWKQRWKGKKAFDDEWNIRISVIKGKVDETNPNAIYQMDGLSGATITTRGVDKMIKFWLGKNGYGPYLKKLRKEDLNG